MASGPKIAGSPLELLSNDDYREKPLLTKIWAPAMCATVGFLSVIAGNWGSKRPFFSGIQKHIMFIIGGAALGKYVDDYRNQYFADREAVFRHYISLHPEDFPDFKREKFGDMFIPWIPIR